jgi:hypothetical protein
MAAVASARSVVAERGFEPRPEAPKAPVLPLHHSAAAEPPLTRNEAGYRSPPPAATSPGAEGRDRTGTGVAPQQFLRLSRLPIPPLRLWSGRRGSNSRPPPWQGGALPLSYFRMRQVGDADISRAGSDPSPPAVPYYSQGSWIRQVAVSSATTTRAKRHGAMRLCRRARPPAISRIG